MNPVHEPVTLTPEGAAIMSEAMGRSVYCDVCAQSQRQCTCPPMPALVRQHIDRLAAENAELRARQRATPTEIERRLLLAEAELTALRQERDGLREKLATLSAEKRSLMPNRG